MPYLFTSESVSEGHPDKVADQISDAILDEFLRQDPESKVAVETLVTTGLVVVCGEVKSNAYVDVEKTARRVIKDIGYTSSDYKFDSESCGVICAIHEQSPDINQGVVREKDEEQGAGDQGMMFGYACKDTELFMPLPIELSHIFLEELSAIRREGKKMKYLRPDSKSQVTVEYSENHKPLRLHTIVLSTQHDEFDEEKVMLEKIREDVQKILIPRVKKQLSPKLKRLFKEDTQLLINPTGKFVIGGPHGDTGLTGRKIIVDTYGGRAPHGGGAFSGKDSSKVDRSAAYATRHIAKNLVAAGLVDEIQVQIAYAIGVAQPVSIHVDSYGTCKYKDDNGKKFKDSFIAEKIAEIFDLRPYAIVNRFGLKNPIFYPSARFGHFGRNHYSDNVMIGENGQQEAKEVEFFPWEKLDYVDKIRRAFNIPME